MSNFYDDDELIADFVGRILEPFGFGDLHDHDSGTDRGGCRWKQFSIWGPDQGCEYLVTIADDQPKGFAMAAVLEHQCREIIRREAEDRIQAAHRWFRRHGAAAKEG